MEESSIFSNQSENARRVFRKAAPVQYTFEIKTFSSLLEANVEKYETRDFEVAGSNWKLVFYPNGNKKGDGGDHISLFLAVAKPEDVSLRWEMNAYVSFFVYDQIRDRYLLIQDANGTAWRFHKMKTAWGFSKLLSHAAFKEPSNGYLVDNCCVFGVDVLVTASTTKGESISVVKEPLNGLYSWKIDKYSTLDKKFMESEVFTVEGRKWNLSFYPKGDSRSSGKHLSVFLQIHNSDSLPPNQRLFAKYTLRIRDQVVGDHYEKTAERWFETPGLGWGYSEFMLLSALTNSSKGYLVQDSMIIEVKFDHVYVVKNLS